MGFLQTYSHTNIILSVDVDICLSASYLTFLWHLMVSYCLTGVWYPIEYFLLIRASNKLIGGHSLMACIVRGSFINSVIQKMTFFDPPTLIIVFRVSQILQLPLPPKA